MEDGGWRQTTSCLAFSAIRYPFPVTRDSSRVLGPIFFLVAVPAQLLLALVFIHLLLALFTSPRHE
jgi:hypothetical protein